MLVCFKALLEIISYELSISMKISFYLKVSYVRCDDDDLMMNLIFLQIFDVEGYLLASHSLWSMLHGIDGSSVSSMSRV